VYLFDTKTHNRDLIISGEDRSQMLAVLYIQLTDFIVRLDPEEQEDAWNAIRDMIEKI
jgi:hypothetical protein